MTGETVQIKYHDVTALIRRFNSSCSIVEIELTQERTLNPLSISTISAINDAIGLAENDQHVKAILFKGRGRSFSCGGDVKVLRNAVIEAGNPGSSKRELAAREILHAEYCLIDRIYQLRHSQHKADGRSITTVAFGNGYVLGAGAGLFQACEIRVASEKAVTAMPETAIGLVPDTAASYFLTKMPGSLGLYSAMTGRRWKGIEMMQLGLCDFLVDSEDFDLLFAQLQADIGKSLSNFKAELTSRLRVFQKGGHESSPWTDGSGSTRNEVDEVFSKSSVGEIRSALLTYGGQAWANEASSAMDASSPTALHTTFTIMRMGYACSLEESYSRRAALAREEFYNLQLAALHDFEEGVRAKLVDKDHCPTWMPVKELRLPQGEDLDITFSTT